MFAFGTLIYLDRRGFAWCVPANLCASLVAGLLAAYGLHLWAGLPIPGIAQIAQIAQLVYLALIVGASPALGAPRARDGDGDGGGHAAVLGRPREAEVRAKA
ncbi:MAG: hypothetical protein ACM3ZF_16280 [Mycobacterium leprae]